MLSSAYNRVNSFAQRVLQVVGSRRFGAFVLLLVCLLALFVSSRMAWIFLPLSKGVRGIELDVPILPLSVFGSIFIIFLLASLAIKLFGKKLQWLLFLPFLLVFCWPFVGSSQFTSYLPQYFSESRDRSIMTELFSNQEVGNVNLQPKYFPYFDVQSNWQHLQASYQILDSGWYLFVVISFIIPFVLSRLVIGQTVGHRNIAFVAIVIAVSMWSFFKSDDFDFPAAVASASGFPKTLEKCEQRLARTPDLAQSDYFVGRCAEAYSAFMGWAGPVANIPSLYTQFGDRSFLRLSVDRVAEFEQQLLALRFMPANSLLEQAFVGFGERHYQTLIAMHAIELVNDDEYTLASSRLSQLSSKSAATNVLVGFIATRMGQPDLSLQAYDQAIAQIGNTSMQANSYCSLGDALVTAGEMEAAREYFQLCRELDGELNYWAIAGLGG